MKPLLGVVIAMLLAATSILSQEKTNPAQRLSASSDQIKVVGQSITAFANDTLAAVTLARIGDLVWKADEEYARRLFLIALSRIDVSQRDDAQQKREKSAALRRVISLMAKHDKRWSTQLIEAHIQESKSKSAANFDIASDLLETDPVAANELAARAIDAQVTPATLAYLKRLRLVDVARADEFFIRSLARLATYPNVDILQIAFMGTYLFRSPDMPSGSPGWVSARIGNIFLPVLVENEEHISEVPVRTYLQMVVRMINRPGGEDRNTRYALGSMILPKVREFTPNLLAELMAGIGVLANDVPVDFTRDPAYKAASLNPKTLEEKLLEIEKLPDSRTRDQQLLSLAYTAYLKKELLSVEIIGDRLSDSDIRNEVRTIVQFSKILAQLQSKDADLAVLEQQIKQLPVGVEQALLYLTAAASADKARNAPKEVELLGMARAAAMRSSDPLSPYLLLYAAGQMASRNWSAAVETYADAIRMFNSGNITVAPELKRQISIAPVKYSFSLKTGINLEFSPAFYKTIAGKTSEVITKTTEIGSLPRDFKSENLQADAYVALTKYLLSPRPNRVVSQEKLVRVDEDGIRKSAVKTSMPIYPRNVPKGRGSGIAVSTLEYDGNGNVTKVDIVESPDATISNAVVTAIKQWKFKPSLLNGVPVRISGKLTFYFSVDPSGKGEVKNPKQYQ